MQAALERTQCSMCRHDLRSSYATGHGLLRISENDKEIVLLHCPNCGSLLIQVGTKVETTPVQAR